MSDELKDWLHRNAPELVFKLLIVERMKAAHLIDERNKRIKELEDRDGRRKAKYLAALDEMNTMQQQLDAMRKAIRKKRPWSPLSYQRGFVHGWNALSDDIENLL